MRVTFLRTAFVCALALSAASASAQDGASTKTLYVTDGWQLKISYYPSKAGRESPVVIFLHGEKQSRKFWDLWKDGWIPKLQQSGFACVAVDLRKHGESVPAGAGEMKLTARDYTAMVQGDLEEVKYFIFKEHQAEKLNMRKMGIVAVDTSVPVALNFAAFDWAKKPWADSPLPATSTPRGQDIRAIAIISPRDKVPGLANARSVTYLSNPSLNLATLTIWSEKDPEDGGVGQALYDKFKAAGTTEKPAPAYAMNNQGKLRGFDLIVGNETAERAFLGFMNKHLKELPDEWVNRKSPADTRIDE